MKSRFCHFQNCTLGFVYLTWKGQSSKVTYFYMNFGHHDRWHAGKSEPSKQGEILLLLQNGISCVHLNPSACTLHLYWPYFWNMQTTTPWHSMTEYTHFNSSACDFAWWSGQPDHDNLCRVNCSFTDITQPNWFMAIDCRWLPIMIYYDDKMQHPV